MLSLLHIIRINNTSYLQLVFTIKAFCVTKLKLNLHLNTVIASAMIPEWFWLVNIHYTHNSQHIYEESDKTTSVLSMCEFVVIVFCCNRVTSSFLLQILTKQPNLSLKLQLNVDQYDYFGNLLSVNNYIQKSWNKKLKNHVNKEEEWVYRTYDTFMSYYNPWNELLVPAGLLQFPFYDYTLPHFMNFGSMGSVIAHHLVHGIDHSGIWFS